MIGLNCTASASWEVVCELEEYMNRLLLLVCGLVTLFSAQSASAQSLNPKAPAPLQAGVNTGTVDNFVGTHYWYFTGGPGETHVHVQFKSMGLLGNPYNSTINVTLSDEGHTWHTTKPLLSSGKPVECMFDGKLNKPTRLILTVAPPAGGLVRMGGDYQVEATGAVNFGEKSSADPVVGVYKQMNGYTQDLGDCKFLADGNIQTTSGLGGNWQLFDKGTQTYVINIDGQTRHSLQLVNARGLCEPDGIIIFQLLK
jgi:hypothetical protein